MEDRESGMFGTMALLAIFYGLIHLGITHVKESKIINANKSKNSVLEVMAKSNVIEKSQDFSPGKEFKFGIRTLGSKAYEHQYYRYFGLDVFLKSKETNHHPRQILNGTKLYAYAHMKYGANVNVVNGGKKIDVLIQYFDGYDIFSYHRGWTPNGWDKLSVPLKDNEFIIFDGYVRTINEVNLKKLKIFKDDGKWFIQDIKPGNVKAKPNASIDSIFKETKKVYNQKLNQYGDLNHDKKISVMERKRFQENMFSYGSYKTEKYDHTIMPQKGSEESLKLGLQWINQYHPNWRNKK